MSCTENNPALEATSHRKRSPMNLEHFPHLQTAPHRATARTLVSDLRAALDSTLDVVNHAAAIRGGTINGRPLWLHKLEELRAEAGRLASDVMRGAVAGRRE